VRKRQREEVWLSLIGGSPNYSPDERDDRQERVRQMEESKNQRYEDHTLYSLSQCVLSTPIDEAVQRVLLKQRPKWQPEESGSKAACQERVIQQPACHYYYEQRHGGGQEQ